MAQNYNLYSLELEKAVLGALFNHEEVLEKISGMLIPQDFYAPSHQIIYQSIIECEANGGAWDYLSVEEHLKKKDQQTARQFKQKGRKLKTEDSLLYQVGGLAELLSIRQNYESTYQVEQFAKEIRRYRVLRELMKVSGEMQSIVSQAGNQSPEQILNEAESKVFEIGEKILENKNTEDADFYVNQVIDHHDHMVESGGIAGVDSGFKGLNEHLYGLQNGGLYVLAARPGVGKTSFALNIATNVAKQGLGVLFFSLEMTGTELYRKIISSQSGISAKKMMLGQVDSKEYKTFVKVAKETKKMPIFVDDASTLRPLDLNSKARRMKKKHKKNAPISLIVIDYIQLMQPNTHSESRAREMAEITGNLKSLAKDLKVPVLALSQLNREVEKFVDRNTSYPKVPQLSDLRESGSIEQDADAVMFISRMTKVNKEQPSSKHFSQDMSKNSPTTKAAQAEEKENPKGDVKGNKQIMENKATGISSYLHQAFVHFAKNRHGKPGFFELKFETNTTTFKEKEEKETRHYYS